MKSTQILAFKIKKSVVYTDNLNFKSNNLRDGKHIIIEYLSPNQVENSEEKML